MKNIFLLTIALLSMVSCQSNTQPKEAAAATSQNPVAAPVAEPQTKPNFGAAGIEDIKGFDIFLNQLQTALIDPAQKEELAKVIAFPIPAAKDKKTFLANYDKIVTPKVREIVKNQKLDALFCRDQGCMFGNGELWVAPNQSGGFAIVGINPTTDNAPLLQGKWQSAEDPKSSFEIADKQIFQYYDGKKMDTQAFSYTADCSGTACSEGKSPQGCFTATGKTGTECQSIISITATELKTSLAGGTGRTLTYKKVN